MDSLTRKKLRQLIESQHWEAIYSFLAIMTDKWHNTPVKTEDEFNTVWNVALKEGKVSGLKEFFDTLEQEVLK